MLAAQVAGWPAQVQAAAATEDAPHGADRLGDGMPDRVANSSSGWSTCAPAALQAQAQKGTPAPSIGTVMGHPAACRTMANRSGAENGVPPDLAQRNHGSAQPYPADVGRLHPGLQGDAQQLPRQGGLLGAME